MARDNLTNKQRAFVEAYLANGFNATQAAITAGYSEQTARSQGAQNLTKLNISEIIRQRVEERTMGANEALIRMSDMARADLGDFSEIRYGAMYIDFEKMKAAGKTHLIKKVKHTKYGIELELYDAQSAIRDIGKTHGLFKDGVQIMVNVELVVQVIDALEKAGLSPSDVFNGMIAELADGQAEQSGIRTDAGTEGETGE